MQGFGVAPEGAKQVHENTMLYDTCRIGTLVPEKYPGGHQDFISLATPEHIPFLNVRNSSEAGLAYTNVTSKDKIPYPMVIESIGFKFHYPDPNMSLIFSGDMSATKHFQMTLPQHAYFKFIVREDTVLILKPTMAPPGYGHTGQFGFYRVDMASAELNSGLPLLGNRWKWTGKALHLPDDTPIRAELYFSPYGKKLLEAMGSVYDLDFHESEPNPEGRFPNEAHIEISLRGKRWIQQRGEYFAS